MSCICRLGADGQLSVRHAYPNQPAQWPKADAAMARAFQLRVGLAVGIDQEGTAGTMLARPRSEVNPCGARTRRPAFKRRVTKNSWTLQRHDRFVQNFCRL